MTSSEPEQVDFKGLTLLRRLVTTLLIVMIIGFIILVGLFINRLGTRGIVDETQLVLPDGVSAISYTKTETWQSVTGDNNVIYLFTLQGEIFQTVKIVAP